MKRLRELSQRVKTILEENEKARDSDNVLYLYVLRSYGEEKGLDIDKMSVPMLLLHCKDMGLPSLESMGRARRKVQELYPELRASDDVQTIKQEREEAYRAFAREVHYV
jgi:hypothetical protein